MHKNPWDDCDKDRLPFYSPAQAAIRWCGLTANEQTILAGLPAGETWINAGAFPHWSCLATHSVNIVHAMETGQLRYGREGRPVAVGETVAKNRRTISHADLKEWLRREFPADVQKPHMAWLFDDVERSMHSGITLEAFQTLQAEAAALKKRAEAAEERARVAEKNARLNADLDPRERASMLRIICALCVMARVPESGAEAVEKQLQMIGFKTPKEAAIRGYLKEASEVSPD